MESRVDDVSALSELQAKFEFAARFLSRAQYLNAKVSKFRGWERRSMKFEWESHFRAVDRARRNISCTPSTHPPALRPPSNYGESTDLPEEPALPGRPLAPAALRRRCRRHGEIRKNCCTTRGCEWPRLGRTRNAGVTPRAENRDYGATASRSTSARPRSWYETAREKRRRVNESAPPRAAVRRAAARTFARVTRAAWSSPNNNKRKDQFSSARAYVQIIPFCLNVTDSRFT